MRKISKKKLFPAIGLVLISGNLITGHYIAGSNFVDFMRGLAVGIGIAFLIFPFIKKKPKIAS